MTGPVWAAPEKLNDIFAQRLRIALAARDLQSVNIADYLNVSSSVVSGWVTGKRYPSTSHLVGISRFLRVSIDWLMDPEPLDTERMFAAARGIAA